MKTQQLFFFTRTDTVQKLQAIEEIYNVHYSIFKPYKSRKLRTFKSFEDLDRKYMLGSSQNGHWYDLQICITLKKIKIPLRQIKLESGEIKYFIKTEKLDFVEFSPGGIYKQRFLISGRVAIMRNANPSTLYKDFSEIILHNTERKNDYIIGKNAAAKHKLGKLYLVSDYQVPTSEYIYLEGNKLPKLKRKSLKRKKDILFLNPDTNQLVKLK